MSFFDTLFKRQTQQEETAIPEVVRSFSGRRRYTYAKNYKNFEIRIKSDEELSEEQQQTIFSTVKDGINHNEISEKIGVNVMINTGIMKRPCINITSKYVEVIF